MIYRIIADIHGCPEKAKAVIKGEYDVLLCLGDIIDLNGDAHSNNECVDLIRAFNQTRQKHIYSVKGNHDISHAAENLKRENVGYLKGLETLIEFPEYRFMMTHVSPFDMPHYSAEGMSDCKRKNYMKRFAREYPELNLCFMGHEHFHKAFMYDSSSGIFEQLKTDTAEILPGLKYFITVGAVNHYSCPQMKPEFAEFDTDRMVVELKKLDNAKT